MNEEPTGSGALADLRDDPTSRKKFMRSAGAGVAGGLAVLLAACGDDKDNSTQSSTTDSGSVATSAPESSATASGSSGGNTGDLEILNYALTLEYLEADFYKQVIDSGLVKDAKVASLAQQFGQSEQDHVDALIKTINAMGGTPVDAPKTAFQSVLDKGLDEVLNTAATVENLGAAAYLGQAPKIQSAEVLAAALSIHSVEARHAAALNQLVGRGFKGSNALEGSIPDGPFAAPMEMGAVLKAVKPFLA